jgi:hypothetical protein
MNEFTCHFKVECSQKDGFRSYPVCHLWSGQVYGVVILSVGPDDGERGGCGGCDHGLVGVDWPGQTRISSHRHSYIGLLFNSRFIPS